MTLIGAELTRGYSPRWTEVNELVPSGPPRGNMPEYVHSFRSTAVETIST
jgi:hypothetical protein